LAATCQPQRALNGYQLKELKLVRSVFKPGSMVDPAQAPDHGF